MISVVIPNVDGGDMLLDCMHSVISQALDDLEVILVDNFSGDGSPEAVAERYPSVRVIHNKRNIGFAAGCNRGADAARGRYVLFLNNDAELPPGSLARLLQVAEEDPSAAIWQPLVLDHAGSVETGGAAYTRAGFLWYIRESQGGTPYPVFVCVGPCILIRRDVFVKLGGFDESYFAYFEEADFCWRARMSGFQARVVPDVRVVHQVGTTTRRLLKPADVYFLGYRNRLRSILANASAKSLIGTVPFHVAACLGNAAAFLLAGRGRSALAVLRALLWPLLHLREIRRQRISAQSQRLRSDNQVFLPELSVRLSPARSWRLLRGTLRRW